MASSAVDLVLSKLGQLATKEASLLLGLEDEIEHVKMKLEWLMEFLADADQKQRDNQHRLVGLWVRQLREVAYCLEDVVDEYAANLDLKRMGFSGWKALPWLHCFISPKKQLFIRHGLASEIRRIDMRLKAISSNRSEYLNGVIESSSLQQQSHKYQTTNLWRTEVEADPVGLDGYVKDLRSELLDSNLQGLYIKSIYGMGGLGKTTLAKKLYNDDEVISHFALRAWLPVSPKFSFEALLKSLMEQLKMEGVEMIESQIKEQIKVHLSKNRFFIVLDDIWETSALKHLKTLFPDEHNGNIVLLTTRNEKIANEPDINPFKLPSLQDKFSWELFCRKVFHDSKCPKNFTKFKQTVIKKCEGLPLAIVVLGALLRERNDPNQWDKFLSQSRRKEDESLSILALSYDYLPHHLKACFLYIVGYPQGSDIEAKTLKWMWIAEGFIQQPQGQTMEDLAEEYLVDLMQRSLIKLVRRDKLGQVSIIRVDELVFDMARNEAQEINFLHQKLSQQSSSLTRRLSVCDEDGLQRHSTSKLRSLHFHSIGSIEVFPSNFFYSHSTKLLRVLCVRGIEFSDGKCPKAIGKMIQLRYLCLSDTNLTELPYHISNLQQLQTLDISSTEVADVPEKFWEIESLRHVISEDDFKINLPTKQNDGKLNELQTLYGCFSYKWIIKDGLRKLSDVRTLRMCGVFVLGSQQIDFKKLEEKLIDGIESLKYLTFLQLKDELASTMVLKAINTSLQYLKLKARKRNGQEGNQVIQQQVQDTDQPPLANLHKIHLCEMGLMQDDIDLIGLLPNVKSMKISRDYKLTKLMFKKGYFLVLEELELDKCDVLESWEVDGHWSNPATILQLLHIGDCPQLKVLPEPELLRVKEIKQGSRYRGTSDEYRLWVDKMKKSSPDTIVTPTQIEHLISDFPYYQPLNYYSFEEHNPNSCVIT